jgi:hypothetical protein
MDRGFYPPSSVAVGVGGSGVAVEVGGCVRVAVLVGFSVCVGVRVSVGVMEEVMEGSGVKLGV